MVLLLAAMLQSASPLSPAPTIREEQRCPDGLQVPADELCPTLIFFNSGEIELSRDAQAALDDLAQALRASPARMLRLIGHTDREGSASANRAVALRRARQVANALRSREINSLVVTSAGEEQPLVPTPDGVREPQNRRVEINVLNR